MCEWADLSVGACEGNGAHAQLLASEAHHLKGGPPSLLRRRLLLGGRIQHRPLHRAGQRDESWVVPLVPERQRRLAWGSKQQVHISRMLNALIISLAGGVTSFWRRTLGYLVT